LLFKWGNLWFFIFYEHFPFPNPQLLHCRHLTFAPHHFPMPLGTSANAETHPHAGALFIKREKLVRFSFFMSISLFPRPWLPHHHQLTIDTPPPSKCPWRHQQVYKPIHVQGNHFLKGGNRSVLHFYQHFSFSNPRFLHSSHLTIHLPILSRHQQVHEPICRQGNHF
jgi:hypothetical protein